MKDKKLRFEDAINATRAAVEEGIVPGGGTMLLHFSESLKQWANLNLSEDELIGALILSKTITAPLCRIVKNAGKNSSLVMEKILSNNFSFGYNAATDKFEDMIKAGIVDPTKVVRSALENAASAAIMFLTTEAIVTDEPKDDDAAPAMPGGMPGMGGGMPGMMGM